MIFPFNSPYSSLILLLPRDQGKSLDLHPDGGQAALHLAGLYYQFHFLTHLEREVLKVFLPSGQLLMDEESSYLDKRRQYGNRRPMDMQNRPEIDRLLLRHMLLDSLLPGTVLWGTKVERIEVKRVIIENTPANKEERDFFHLRLFGPKMQK